MWVVLARTLYPDAEEPLDEILAPAMEIKAHTEPKRRSIVRRTYPPGRPGSDGSSTGDTPRGQKNPSESEP
jgi:hypothetical protein